MILRLENAGDFVEVDVCFSMYVTYYWSQVSEWRDDID